MICMHACMQAGMAWHGMVCCVCYVCYACYACYACYVWYVCHVCHVCHVWYVCHVCHVCHVCYVMCCDVMSCHVCMYIIYPPVVKHGKSTCFFVRRKSELETSVDRGFSSGIAPHRGGVGVVAALLAVGLGDLAVDHHHVGPEEVLRCNATKTDIIQILRYPRIFVG